ncbi:hypothetical protein EVAR_83949_1 [Eumeta japonica]|uniref:Uncharacterized protein n=1 Tax=Eumeta variegata TaxID=151549 RepID=A0A4C1VQ04_EUMVA|nr:hypothetical protein EVAR_83949_1 [Eumeta japonica]
MALHINVPFPRNHKPAPHIGKAENMTNLECNAFGGKHAMKIRRHETCIRIEIHPDAVIPANDVSGRLRVMRRGRIDYVIRSASRVPAATRARPS